MVAKIKMNYNYSKDMWLEIGRYCVNSRGELSIHIPTDAKTEEERIKKGEFRVLKINKIEFEQE